MRAGPGSVTTANPLTFLCSPRRSLTADHHQLHPPRPSLRSWLERFRRHPGAQRAYLPRAPCSPYAPRVPCAEPLRKERAELDGGYRAVGSALALVPSTHSAAARTQDSAVQTRPLPSRVVGGRGP